jgi:hypothetical protein
MYHHVLDGEVAALASNATVFLSSVPLGSFVEHHVTCDEGVPEHRVKHPVSLGAPFVSDEHHLLPAIFKLRQMWLHIPGIRDAAKSTEVSN